MTKLLKREGTTQIVNWSAFLRFHIQSLLPSIALLSPSCQVIMTVKS